MSQKSLKTLSLLLSLLVSPSLSLVAADDPYLFKSDDSTVEKLLDQPSYENDKYKTKFIQLLQLTTQQNTPKMVVSIDKTTPRTINININDTSDIVFSIKYEQLNHLLLTALLKIAIQNQNSKQLDFVEELRNFLVTKALPVGLSCQANRHLVSISGLINQLSGEYQKSLEDTKDNKGTYIHPITQQPGIIQEGEVHCSSQLLAGVNGCLTELDQWYGTDAAAGFHLLSSNSSLSDARSQLKAIQDKLQAIASALPDDANDCFRLYNPSRLDNMNLFCYIDKFLSDHSITVSWSFSSGGNSVANKIKLRSIEPFALYYMKSSNKFYIHYDSLDSSANISTVGDHIFENSGVEDFYIPPFSCKVDPKVFGGSHVNQLFIPQGYQGSFAEMNTWCSSMANKDFDASTDPKKDEQNKTAIDYGDEHVSVLVEHADLFPLITIKKKDVKNTSTTSGSNSAQPASGTNQSTKTSPPEYRITKELIDKALQYQSDGKTSVSRGTPVTIIVDESITSIEEDAFAPLKDFIVGRMVLTPSARLCQSLKTTSTSLFDRNNPQSIKVNQLILRGPNVQRFIDQKLNTVFYGAKFHRVNIVAAMKSFDQASLTFLENTGVEQLYIAGPVGSVGHSSVEKLAGLKRLEFNPMGQHVNWAEPEKPVFDTEHVYHFNPLYRLDKKQPDFISKKFDWKKEYRTNSVAYAAEWPDSPFANSTLEYVNIPYYVTGFKANWCSGCQNLKEVECYRFKGNHSYNWGTLSKKVMEFFSNVPTGCTINFASGHMTKVEKNCLDGLSPDLKNSLKIKISLNHAQFKKDGLTKDILSLPNIVGVGLPWNYPYPLKDDLFEYCNKGQINKDFELWMSDYCKIPATSISDDYAKKTGLKTWYWNYSDGHCLQFDKNVSAQSAPTNPPSE